MEPRSHQRFDLGRFLRLALAELRVPQKVIVIDARLSKGFLSRVLSGDQPLPPRLVDELPVDVQRSMCAAWATELGMFIGERDRLVALARSIVAQAASEETIAARSTEAAVLRSRMVAFQGGAR